MRKENATEQLMWSYRKTTIEDINGADVSMQIMNYTWDGARWDELLVWPLDRDCLQKHRREKSFWWNTEIYGIVYGANMAYELGKEMDNE